jgi:WD40 repeat protein
VWDPAAEPGVRTLFKAGNTAGCLAVSADGARVAVGPRGLGNPMFHLVRVFDPATGAELRAVPGTGDVAFHPDGNRLATGRVGGGVAVWDATTGAEVWGKPAPGLPGLGPNAPGCQRVAFSPDGRLLACWDVRGGGVRLYAADDGAEVGAVAAGGGFVYSIAFAPDSRRLAVAAKDRLAVYDVTTGTAVQWEEAAAGAFAVAFTPDGATLAAAEDKEVRLRDAATGRVVRAFVGSPGRVNALAFGANGTRLVTGACDRRVQVWDADSGRELLALPGVGGAVTAVAWDRDRVFALDDSLRVWPAPPAE